MSNGNYSAAIEIVNKTINATGPQKEWVEVQSYINQKLHNFELALEGWNSLIAYLPNEAAYYLERGVCKFNLRYKSAIEDFNQAIILEPNNAYFHSALAYILDKQGRLTEAVAHYQIAIELEPDNEITINNLAVTEQKRGNMSSAEELFKATDDLLIQKGLMPERLKPEPIKKGAPKEIEIAKTKKYELIKMLSSWEGFKAFLNEAVMLIKKKV
jgi:tetratricopeptide (TPR) repeat protein